MATIFAYSGNLAYNPTAEVIPVPGNANGLRFVPPQADELPPSFLPGVVRYQAPTDDSTSVALKIDPDSDRLQLITQFPAWADENVEGMPILIKVKGKCTTDHISPAGPWYKYRGHLENISNNMLIAATNAFTPAIGHALHPITAQVLPVPQVARELKASGIRWCVIGDTNYGEGSSREHAALEPRFLGGVAIIAKSFARIHETNLKKQGVLPLTFDDVGDYDRIVQGDVISLHGVQHGEMEPGKQVVMHVVSKSGETWTARLNHSYHEGQIKWLRAGSALNHIRHTLQRSSA